MLSAGFKFYVLEPRGPGWEIKNKKINRLFLSFLITYFSESSQLLSQLLLALLGQFTKRAQFPDVTLQDTSVLYSREVYYTLSAVAYADGPRGQPIKDVGHTYHARGHGQPRELRDFPVCCARHSSP